MHTEQSAYLRAVKVVLPSFFHGRSVLEIGSCDVNGSMRPLFTACEYVGLDCHAGPAVDVVSLAHDYHPGRLFDVVATAECFEHDKYLALTVPHILSLLRPGGLFIGTWGGPTRPEHGTRRTEDAGGTWGPDPDFYANVSAEEFTALAAPYLDPLEVGTYRDGQDVYALGVRRETVGIRPFAPVE